jgi:hypothetical protein
MASIQKQDGEAIRRRLVRIGKAVAVGGALAIACLISYVLITHLLSQVYFVSRDDGLLGGMWAVVATVLFIASVTKRAGVPPYHGWQQRC